MRDSCKSGSLRVCLFHELTHAVLNLNATVAIAGAAILTSSMISWLSAS